MVVGPALAALVLLGPASGSAFAAGSSPAADQYGGVAGESGGGVLGVTAGGSLPFTGANLVVYAGVGLVMVGAGFALRGMAGRKRPASHR